MAAEEILSLLGVLRDSRSPLTKAKLLARLAGELRNLDKAERLAILSRLGLEKADRLVDNLGDETKHPTAVLIQEIVDRAEQAEPAQWRQLIEDFRDPRKRTRLVERGLELLREGEPEYAPEEVDETAVQDEPPGQPGAAVPTPDRPETSASAMMEAGEQEAAELDAIAPPSVAPEPPLTTKPQVADEAVPSEPALPEPVTKAPAGKIEYEAEEPIEPLVVSSGLGRVRSLEEPTLINDLTGNRSLVHRFRFLRERVDETSELSSEGLRALLAAFPVGWARRRALSVLLEAGLPAVFSSALALVEETQERPTDRLWSLGVIADTWELSPSEQERLLKSAGTSAWRRRLARRLEASA